MKSILIGLLLLSTPETQQSVAAVRVEHCASHTLNGPRAEFVSVTLSSGVRVDGVRYERQRLSGMWVLRLRMSDGMGIVRPGDRSRQLTRDEFAELIGSLLNHVAQQKGGGLDAIHVDAALVGPLWGDAIVAGRALRRDAGAKVHTQDAELSRVILGAIRSDPAIQQVCAAIAKTGRTCDRFALQMDPVPLRPEHSGAAWGALRAMPDLGLDVGSMWFSIRLSGASPKR